MKKIYKLILILAIFLVCCAPVYAQTPPRIDEDYQECSVYYGGRRLNENAYTIKGNLYVNIDTLQKYGDISKFKINTSELKMYFNPSDMNIYIADKDTTSFIKKYAGSMYLNLKNIYGEYYVSLGSVAQLAGLTYSYDDYRISINSLDDSTQFGIVSENGALAAGSVNTGTSENMLLSGGEIAYIIDETTSFYKIQTLSGDTAYVSKSSFTQAEEGAIAFDYVDGKGHKKDFNGKKINLVWVSGGNRTDLCPNEVGIDVVSPCWFNTETSADGTIRNYCDYGFVELAHVQGYEVWACANDFGTGMKSSVIRDMLSDETNRNKQVAQLLMYASLFDLDGINMDYETIIYYKANYVGYTELMRTLGIYCEKMGLTLSVDTNVPTKSNQTCFDYISLGEICDYVIPMTYAQSDSSGAACSVSDRNYYTTWISEMIKLVPSHKVMMGIPFYGVSWVYKTDGTLDYKSTITMLTERARLTENNVTPVWNENLHQYYAEYYSNADGQLRKMFIEDSRSIAHRIQYIYEAGLAGSGCWRYGQQESDILDVFYRMNSCGASVYEFDTAY